MNVVDRLEQLCVGDVMRREVVEISTNHSMTAAARILGENHISGAPIVDDYGRCIGMLSAVDFVRREVHLGNLRALTIAHTEAEGVNNERDETVCPYMSTEVQAVHAGIPLIEAARLMCRAHIHRLPVLDARGQAIGMVTSMDLVAAMMHAIDEHKEVNHERHRHHATPRGLDPS